MAPMTHDEKHSALWLKMRDHYTMMLARLRETNDGRGMPEADTAFLRGRIAQVKEFLALEKDPGEVTDSQ